MSHQLRRQAHRCRKPSTPKTGEELKESRRAYQRQYYREHRDKAREYQRLYNMTYKKKYTGRHPGLIYQREAKRMTFTTVDLMAAPVEKVAVMLAQILDGKRLFTL